MLNQDFKEFIESLNANGVRYLVVGSYAVALHGHPRYTKDIDIWLERSPDNAARIIRALERFGFASLRLKADDFLVPDQIIQLGYPPNRIDMLTSVPGMDSGLATLYGFVRQSRERRWIASIGRISRRANSPPAGYKTWRTWRH